MIGMLGVIASALGIIMSGYLLVGSAGYIAYPLNANSNILNSFPADDHIIQVRVSLWRFSTQGSQDSVHFNDCNPEEAVHTSMSRGQTDPFVGPEAGLSMRNFPIHISHLM